VIAGCLGECTKIINEKENQPCASFNVCKSVLNSKSKDETLVGRFFVFLEIEWESVQQNNEVCFCFFQANFAKWEPWHGKFGFSYPWERYLKIGEILRELAAFILAMRRCLEASKEVGAYFLSFLRLLYYTVCKTTKPDFRCAEWNEPFMSAHGHFERITMGPFRNMRSTWVKGCVHSERTRRQHEANDEM